MQRFLVAIAGAAALLPGSAQAQDTAEITIYSKGGFKGASLSFSEPTQHITPAFTARSVRISGDAAWELCSGNTYTGCRRVDRSTEGGVFTVRSARPIAPVIVTRVSGRSSGAASASGSPPNLSLRGVDGEFFVAPDRGGQRVAVPGNNPEAMRRAADEFCRNAGWRQSVHARLQSVGGTYYLVDVLCSNIP
jgi:hypothetical protein